MLSLSNVQERKKVLVMSMLHKIRIFAVSAVICVGSLHYAMAATPPVQPFEGPGSSGDQNLAVTKRVLGEEGSVIYAFFTKTKTTTPKPVVIFLHPWGGIQPQAYGHWFDQLARKGYLVIFPQYQIPNVTESTQATQRAKSLIGRAFTELKNETYAQADPERISYIGHLAGAVIAVNLATEPDKGYNPKLVLALMPGGIARDEQSAGIPLADLSKINPLTSLVAMSADRASNATDRAARRILTEASQIPPDRKLFIKTMSDGHGYPRLFASLASPGSFNDMYSQDALGKAPPRIQTDEEAGAVPVQRTRNNRGNRNRKGQRTGPRPSPRLTAISGEQQLIARQVENNGVDALDYLGYWKTFELLANMAFSGGEITLLSNDPAFVGMGVWSDGFPAKRLWVEVPTPKVTADQTP